jgi:hypothetical protein
MSVAQGTPRQANGEKTTSLGFGAKPQKKFFFDPSPATLCFKKTGHGEKPFSSY